MSDITFDPKRSAVLRTNCHGFVKIEI